MKNQDKNTDEFIDMRSMKHSIIKRWWWFLVSLAFFVGAAVFYVMMKQPQYVFHSQILIEEDGDNGGSVSKGMGGMGQMMRAFSIGGFGSASVDNEVLILSSHDLMRRTVKTLGLNCMYMEKIGLKKRILFKEKPVVVSALPEMMDTMQGAVKMKLKISDTGKVDVSVVRGMFSSEIFSLKGQVLPLNLNTQIGKFQLLKTERFNEWKGKELIVSVCGYDEAVAYYLSEIEIGNATKKSDAIELTMQDANKERGKAILNTIMQLYEEWRVEHKNEKANNELFFWNQQITELSGQLNDAERKVEQFKLENELIDVGTESSMLTAQNQDAKAQVLELHSQQMVCDMALKLLRDEKNKYVMLPTEGMGEKASNVAAQYNELVTRRNLLARSAKESNVTMKELTRQIDDMRSVAVENIEQFKLNAQVAVNNILGQSDKNKKRLGSMPKFERRYYDLMRDKELKNDLYVFLLEKRASSALKASTSASIALVIDPAYNDIKPVMKKSYMVLGFAFVMSFLLPTIVIFILDRKRNRRKEFDEMGN